MNLFCCLQCWETYVGQELYKLVVMDFLVLVASTFTVDFLRKCVTRSSSVVSLSSLHIQTKLSFESGFHGHRSESRIWSKAKGGSLNWTPWTSSS